MQLWLARPISQAVLAAKQFRPLDAHKGEDLAFEPLRHILAGKDMLLYHTSQFSRGEEKMSSFFSYVGSLRIAWVKGGTSDIGKVLFAQMFPEMFRRIEFRAVGWLWDQADVLRHLEIFGMMPSRLIHLHHDKRVLEGLGDMLQKEIHHAGIIPPPGQRGH